MMLVASDPTQRLKVASALRQASVYGLTLARTWAFSDGTAASNKPLQSAPGSYNEAMFQGLDFVVSEAHKNGIYLIMSLVNYYSDFGGRKQYVQWAREKGQNVTSTDDFYTNIMIKGFYKNHVKTILTRRNTINGMIYKDDPTILAWELINEPRCESDLSGKILQNWITEMATYVKSIDKKHLLDVGMEGFYGNSTPEKKYLNPGGIVFGTDFLIHNQIKGIDFATFHAYPDIWLSGSVDKVQLEYMKNWTESHVQDAGRILKKPILMGEFGKSLKPKGGSIKSRDALMVITYTMILHSARNNGPFAGGLFWQLLDQALGQFQDGYGIVLPEFPSTAALIASHSRTLSNLNHHL
ncbi:mannan endo-1,4-beta-mannosidase 1-like [Dioscorea cayenensis subsp. rotundata]|uniref:mannan endo-1,4-beta-mannosidase n=1 Tax=Dioscorea cayennensis subsp. rotundata TaxID=55577 RepID=A0AB40AFZ3_DIOCR|nr:mannan endo-1,4-beta-mannosidase 1-like [Dioscorea cayenensis subsp. rotundata]